MNINIKYGPINKHKGSINYHKPQLIDEFETPKRKEEEEDPRVENKSKKKKLSLCSTSVAKWG